MGASLFCLPGLDAYLRAGVEPASTIFGWTRMSFTLQMARPEDLSLMPDKDSRVFLEEALAQKAVLDETVRQGRSPENVAAWEYLTLNTSSIALPIGKRLCEDFKTMDTLFTKVSAPIWRHRLSEYFQIVRETFEIALVKNSRVGAWFPVPLLLGTLILLMMLERGRWACLGFVLSSVHLCHMGLVALTTIPVLRYTYATEFLLVLALFVTGGGLTRRWHGRFLRTCKSNRSVCIFQ